MRTGRSDIGRATSHVKFTQSRRHSTTQMPIITAIKPKMITNVTSGRLRPREHVRIAGGAIFGFSSGRAGRLFAGRSQRNTDGDEPDA